MPRGPRIVVPDLPHHVVQRGNRRQPLFFSDEDRAAYIRIVSFYCAKHGTRCLAWCLMDNHVHLILTPSTADGLRATIAAAHTAYAQRVNAAQSMSGHLFEGRFRSYPMDDSHLMVAVRYIENNPVKAQLVAAAEGWRWSSARAHIHGRDDGLTDIAALGGHIANWRAMLARGLEASDEAAAAERGLAAGLPVGTDSWRQELMARLGIRPPGKRGPKGPRPII